MQIIKICLLEYHTLKKNSMNFSNRMSHTLYEILFPFKHEYQ